MLNKFISTIERFIPLKWRWVLGHEGFKRYFANTGWMFFGQMFSILVSFFVGVWVVRYLGPENYGIVSYVLAFVGLFSFVAGLGVDNILKRELINFPEKRNLLMGTAFRLRFIGGLLASILAISIIFLIESSPLVKGLVSLYAFVFIFQSVHIIATFFESKVEARKNTKAQIIAITISALLKVGLILSGLGVIWLMLIYLLDSLWMALAFIFHYRRSSLRLMDWSFDFGLAKKILADSWLLALTTVSVLIYMKIDQIMIREMLGNASVGLYSAAVRIFELSYIVPSIICGSLFPAILHAKKTSLTSYYNRLKNLSFLLLFLSIIMAVVISVFSGFIVRFLFGPEYLGSIVSLKIGAWSVVGISLGIVVGQYLIAENYVRTYFYITLIGAIINIGLNYLFIPIYGIGGAAGVTVFSYLMVPVSLLLFRKMRGKFRRALKN